VGGALDISVWSREFIEKLTVPYRAEVFPELYPEQRLITVLLSTLHRPFTRLPDSLSRLYATTTSTASKRFDALSSSCQKFIYKIWRFHGGYYEECLPLGYKPPVHTSWEIHYVSAGEPRRLMLCKMWDFHGGDYEEYRLLGYYTMWLLLRSDVSEERIALRRHVPPKRRFFQESHGVTFQKKASFCFYVVPVHTCYVSNPHRRFWSHH
jgi:hypothetical protein